MNTIQVTNVECENNTFPEENNKEQQKQPNKQKQYQFPHKR